VTAVPALIVDALAAYRITKLLTDDAITEDARRWLVEHVAYDSPPEWASDAPTAVDLVGCDDDPPKLAILLTCRWCMGFWVAVGVVAARRLVPRQWAPVADVAAMSACAALLAGFED
jgi:hypothetical protein